MKPLLPDRIRRWICRHFGHRPYDDGNVMVCRRCHVLTGPRTKRPATEGGPQ